MGSSYTYELINALATDHHNKAAIRPTVLRLTRSIKERVESADQSSLDFIKTSVHLLKRINPSICAVSCFEGFSNSVPYLHAQGQLGTALIAAESMVSLACHLNRKDLLRQAENYTGIIHRALANTADAIVHYQRSLSLAQELGDQLSEAIVLSNLSGLLTEAGLYRESEACIARALSLSHAPGRKNLLFNLAILFSQTGRRHDALRIMKESLDIVFQPIAIQEWYSRALREANYIFLALELDDLPEAKRHLELCRESASRSGTAPSFFFVRLATGLCMVREGNQEEGVAVLNEAMHNVRRLGLAPLALDAFAALAWAHEASGQPTQALAYVRKMIEHIAGTRRACLDALEAEDRFAVANETPLDPLKYREAKLEAASTQLEARASRLDMLQRLAMAATLRDDPSGMHGYRVGRLSSLLAAKVGWSPDRCYELEMAARLHDIGKAAVPDHILLTSGPLKNAERDFIRSHPEVGSSLLINATDPESRLASDIALFHHERWDGNGYPKRLTGARIPLSARIVSISDVFDALTHGRPYASPWPIEKALIEIRESSGLQFDPDLVDPFVQLIADLTERYGDPNTFLEAAAGASPFLAARKKIEAMLVRERQY